MSNFYTTLIKFCHFPPICYHKTHEKADNFRLQMEDHHVCTGSCKGISPSPGVCQTDKCENKGEPLEKCDCEDGKHYREEESTDSSDKE